MYRPQQKHRSGLISNIRDKLGIDSHHYLFESPHLYKKSMTSDTKEMIDALKLKFPNIKGPIKEDICYATTNRQAAVKKIAANCEMFFIIGSRNSSNSARLVEVAKKSGCKNSELIFSHTENLSVYINGYTINTNGHQFPVKL